VQQYIEGTTDIELVGLRPSAAKAAGYSISVSSDKEWLTADGSSQAKITAQVLQNGGPVAGHTVVFSVVGEGRIKTVNAVTDATGSARAVYTAGTKIGLVLVKATDVTIGLSGSVQIELRSDAPAKIAFEVKVLDPIDAADSTGKGLPELYADGRSRADLTVLITDINDNPNKDTTVTYAMAAGSGTLEQVKSVTDQDGKSYATFKAGQLPGTATIKVTVASNVPSAADKGAAENAVLTVPDFEFITE
jgi:adhesin/invasin